MARNKRNSFPKTVWAYAYQIVPPQPEDRLNSITSILEHANVEAQRASRAWTARVVAESHITHILVMSDSAEQNREFDRRIESALLELNAGFSLSDPVAVRDDGPLVPAKDIPPV